MDGLNEAFDAFAEVVTTNERFVVVSHVDPDGDAVGATLALGLLLRQLGKTVCTYNRDAIPYNFQFLAGAADWCSTIEEADWDVTVLLDCAAPTRIGEKFPEAGWGDTVVVVDHHKTFDPDFADLYVRDPAAAATGELVYEMVRRLGTLTTEIAEPIYCCLTTDTGSFRYSNTSKRTFTIAGELVEAGVNPWKMTSAIYESEPVERLRLLACVLETLRLSDDGKLAFLRIDREAMADSGAGDGMLDGFINYARSVRGVEVATQLRQADDDLWKVSFRSRGLVDVSELAARFGGGGHHNAAGCEIAGDPSDIERRLADALIELLSAKSSPG